MEELLEWKDKRGDEGEMLAQFLVGDEARQGHLALQFYQRGWFRPLSPRKQSEQAGADHVLNDIEGSVEMAARDYVPEVMTDIYPRFNPPRLLTVYFLLLAAAASANTSRRELRRDGGDGNSGSAARAPPAHPAANAFRAVPPCLSNRSRNQQQQVDTELALYVKLIPRGCCGNVQQPLSSSSQVSQALALLGRVVVLEEARERLQLLRHDLDFLAADLHVLLGAVRAARKGAIVRDQVDVVGQLGVDLLDQLQELGARRVEGQRRVLLG